MSTLVIKTLDELARVTELSESDLALIKNAIGSKAITVANLRTAITGALANLTTTDKSSIVAAINELVAKDATLTGIVNPLTFHNAGSHNAQYRGKTFTEIDATHYAQIQAGTFDDFYPGDKIIRNGRTYLAAHLDYWLDCGDTACNTHHLVLIPETQLGTAKMNDTNTTEGGYIGSAMRTTNLAAAKALIEEDFGASHILTHREYMENAMSSGRPSAGAWTNSDVDLMNERMVYGAAAFEPANDGTNIPTIYTTSKTQLAIFQHDPSKITTRSNWWLRTPVSAAYFANVNNYGHCNYNSASNALGVRPAFAIKA